MHVMHVMHVHVLNAKNLVIRPVPSLQEESWSLDIPCWEPKEASKLMKFVKAMKPKFNVKKCPIQIKTDKNIFTGEWRCFSIPITITYPNAIDTKWYYNRRTEIVLDSNSPKKH